MYVYFIRAGIYTKIGVAKNVERRLKQIQTGNPLELKLECAIKTDSNAEAYQLESDLHAAFMSKHKHGEWFFLRHSQINKFIKKYSADPSNKNPVLEGCDVVKRRDTEKLKKLRFRIKAQDQELSRLRSENAKLKLAQKACEK